MSRWRWHTTIGDKVEAAYRRGDLFAKRAQLMAGVGEVLCVAGAGQCQGRADARAGVVRALRLPGFGNRVQLACGYAFETGDTSELDELLKQVIAGKTGLTPAERRTLRAYRAGKLPWRRGRGQWKTHGGVESGRSTRSRWSGSCAG